MIKLNYDIILTILLISIVLNFILSKFKLFKSKNFAVQIQDIHTGNPSRLGGVVIYIVFLGYIFLSQNYYFNIWYYSLIILLPAFLEDIRVPVKPLLRFIAILGASFLIITNFSELPKFEFGFFNDLVNNRVFQVIFYSLAMATVINGQNIIDGTNGLSAFTSLAIFSSILFLGFYLHDQRIVDTTLPIITLILAFLFFNYPYGKIFLGDGGSYFLGMLASYLVIKIFAQYPKLPTWSAVSILFYPTLEVLFSYFRKIFQKKSPFFPDNLHLHLKIFYLLSYHRRKTILYNALVAPFLGVVWLSPLALLPFSLQYPHWSLLCLIGLICIYLFFYFAIPNPNLKASINLE